MCLGTRVQFPPPPLMNNSYVYCWFDAIWRPVYIGQGRNGRANSHWKYWRPDAKCKTHFQCWLRKMAREGVKPHVVVLQERLTEKEAMALEVQYIKTIGREDLKTGSLFNHTDGGEGATNLSLEVRQKKSAAHKRAWARPGAWERGKKVQKEAQNRPEVRARRSAAAQKQRKIQTVKMKTMNRPEVRAAIKEVMNRPWVRAAVNRPEVKVRRLVVARHQPSRSRFRGIFKRGESWRARIKVLGQRKYLGAFKTPELAAQAYNDAVDKYWGGDGWKNRVINIPVVVDRRKQPASNSDSQ